MRQEDLGELIQQPRFQTHMNLEDAIIKHGPDAVEAQELLHCLIQSLDRRYSIKSRERCSKLMEAFDDLNDRLEDLQSDLYEPEAYDNQDGL